jgi:hypothetical protein
VTKTIWTFMLIILLAAGFARAEDAPLVSSKRLSVASGLNYEWRTTPLANNSEPVDGRHAEWSAGFYAAYNLTPHSSLVASSVIGLDSRQLRNTVGVRLRLWNGTGK